jgi:hypothetical protein
MSRALAVFFLACSACSPPPPRVIQFEKQTLDRAFRSEGVAVLDVDRDGQADIVTDQFWYAGPDLQPREIRAPATYDINAYSENFGTLSRDVDGDGYDDIVIIPFPTGTLAWYRNPRGAAVPWERFVIGGSMGLESPILADLFGTGRPVVLASDSSTRVLGWYEPPADPTKPWPLHPISGPDFPGAGGAVHGIGAGDMDGDGDLDVVTTYAWFEQSGQQWIQHDVQLDANRCSEMQVLDADGDGRADVFCPVPHDYGFSWFRQEADGQFTKIPIDMSISQMHALVAADLDGDGAPELVSGKRFWSHDNDPGATDPAMLVVYKLRRDAGQVSFDRLDIDNDSGISTQFAAKDVNGDGHLDIVVSSKKGLHFFRAL